MAEKSPFVVLGRIVKPHGVRGELRVEYYAESPELLEKPLLLRAGRLAPRPVRVRAWRSWRGQLIVALDGCESCSAAEALRGQELLIDAAFLPEAEEDAPYLRDMVGLSVRLEDGSPVGVLEEISSPAGQELWIIRAPEAAGGQEILFPAVPQFVRSIDVAAGLAVIAPPDGLLDLYAASPAQAGAERNGGV